jgi:hypothetical protein
MQQGLFVPPHSNGKVSASYADGGVSRRCQQCMTPPSRYDRDTSPFEWGGGPKGDGDEWT